MAHIVTKSKRDTKNWVGACDPIKRGSEDEIPFRLWRRLAVGLINELCNYSMAKTQPCCLVRHWLDMFIANMMKILLQMHSNLDGSCGQ